jgi:hypothetical protein
MNTIQYDVKRDFLAVRFALAELPEQLRLDVAREIERLGIDPRPDGCSNIDGNVYKIVVSDEVQVTYEISTNPPVVDLITIKRVGKLRRALDLLKFKP